jgi:hypothetical protein
MNDEQVKEIATEIYDVMEVPLNKRPTIVVKPGRWLDDSKKVIQRAKKGGVPAKLTLVKVDEDQLFATIHEVVHMLQPAKFDDGDDEWDPHPTSFLRLEAKFCRYFGFSIDEFLSWETRLTTVQQKVVETVYASQRDVWFTRPRNND